MSDFKLSVPGQEKAILNLYQLYETNRIPHALLFTGLKGVGKHFAAVQFANLINSRNSSENDSIQNKISHLSVPFVKLIHPLPRGKGEKNDSNPYEKLTSEQVEDIRIEIENKIKNPYYQLQIERAFNIKINSINEIRRFVSFTYDDSNTGVILILDAHLMNKESQNALLKTLEEPPEGFVFILITDQKSSLLNTVISRCWEIEFAPLSNEILKKILIDRFEVPKGESEILSNFAQGSVAYALELLDLDLEDLLEKVITVLRYSLGQRYYTALNSVNEIIKEYGETNFLLSLRLILHWLRDTQINTTDKSDLIYFKKYKDTLDKFNERFIDAEINRLFTTIDNLIQNHKKQVSLNLIALNAIFELSTVGIR